MSPKILRRFSKKLIASFPSRRRTKSAGMAVSFASHMGSLMEVGRPNLAASARGRATKKLSSLSTRVSPSGALLGFSHVCFPLHFIQTLSPKTAVLATWAPLLYDYYDHSLGLLFLNDTSLERNFSNSVFPTASYNFGPQMVCMKHKDFANLPFGMCPVTAFGSYNYTEGGHLILWDCPLVVEFPPGCTILLPSAVIAHSNVAIASHDTCYSFT